MGSLVVMDVIGFVHEGPVRAVSCQGGEDSAEERENDTDTDMTGQGGEDSAAESAGKSARSRRGFRRTALCMRDWCDERKLKREVESNSVWGSSCSLPLCMRDWCDDDERKLKRLSFKFFYESIEFRSHLVLAWWRGRADGGCGRYTLWWLGTSRRGGGSARRWSAG